MDNPKDYKMEMNDRKHRNRINQRQRRLNLMRIDYIPNAEARNIIELQRKLHSLNWHHSDFINAAIIEWAGNNLTTVESVRKHNLNASEQNGAMVESTTYDRKPTPKYRWR